MNGRWCLRNCKGFSAAECTSILAALTILSGLSAPAITDYIEDAKMVRARHDVATLGVSVIRLFNDVASERNRPGGWRTYSLLVGAGAAPAVSNEQTAPWALATGVKDVGMLDDQLLRNGPGYTPFVPAERRGWRGATLQHSVTAEPWAHRFAVNVGAMGRDADIFVMSAGPDGAVTVSFDADGLDQAGDDIVTLVSSAGVTP
jgi:hypothetical protein